MSKQSETKTYRQSTLFAPASPVKTSPWLENAKDWQENEQAYSSSLNELCLNFNRNGLSLKMYPGSYLQMSEGTLPQSLDGWGNAGIFKPTGSLILNIGESHSEEDECSLPDILEDQVPSKYYLSPKACRGILRRAEKRGRELPRQLQDALEAVARTDNKAQGGFYVSETAAPISAKTHGRTYGDDELSGNLMVIPEKATAISTHYAKGTDSDMTQTHIVTHALQAKADGSEDGTGRGTPIITFSSKDNGRDASDISPSLRSMNNDKSNVNGGGQVAVAFQSKASSQNSMNLKDKVPALSVGKAAGSAVSGNFGVRRLTPKECERLQGFPDNYTRYGIDETGNTVEMSDTQRYRQLGNAITVSVSGWIGQRIQKAEQRKMF